MSSFKGFVNFCVKHFNVQFLKEVNIFTIVKVNGLFFCYVFYTSTL